MRDRLDRLAASLRLREGESPVLRGATLREAFAKGLAKHVEVSVPELESVPSDPDSLAGTAATMSLRYRSGASTPSRRRAAPRSLVPTSPMLARVFRLELVTETPDA